MTKDEGGRRSDEWRVTKEGILSDFNLNDRASRGASACTARAIPSFETCPLFAK